jgi:plastocyanin
MNPTRRSLLQAVGTAGLAGLAGCTDVFGSQATTESPTVTPADPPDSATATPTSSGPQPEESASISFDCHDGEEEAYVVRPPLVWVEPGVTVLWGTVGVCRQRALAYHPDNDAPLRVPEGTEGWSSPILQGDGATYEYTFEQPGVYNYFGLHEGDGQVGLVLVGRPDPEGQPGLTEPGEDIPEPARTELSRLVEEARSLLES